MEYLWIPVVLFAAAAQTVRNTARRSLTAQVGTLPATLVRFLYGLPFAALYLLALYLFGGWQDIEVWMDDGIRSGQDVLRARALGAQGTTIGRSFLYGLGAYGQAGVRKALQIIHKELDTTMAFCGHTHIDRVGRETLLPGT
jgi:hypothetical protein